MMCEENGIDYDQWAFEYLLTKWYQKPNRDLQAVQPRDLLKIVRALCEYEGIPPKLTPELIDDACRSYFVGSENGG
jgi:hypothetical protein